MYKTKSCKHQSHERIFLSEIDKYIASFFFNDEVLYFTLLDYCLFFFLSFLKSKISMKLKKN